MTALGPEGRALFRKARQDLAPTDAERARMDRAFASKLGVAAGAGVAATLATKTATASVPPAIAGGAAATSSAGLVVKILGTLAIVGAVSGGAALYVAHENAAPPAAPSVVAAHAPITTSTSQPPALPRSSDPPVSSPLPGISPLDLPSATPPRRPVPASSPARLPPPEPTGEVSAPVASAGGTVAAETRMLRDADAALRSGDAALALKLVDEHARLYPRGVLREERMAERIFALCKLGRTDEARSEAERFLRDNSESPLAASVRSSCGGRAER